MVKNTTGNKAIVWGQPSCTFCKEAVKMLEARGLVVDYREVDGVNWTREQFAAANPTARTVPQIYIGSKYIGSYPDMREYLRHNNVILVKNADI